MILLDFSTWWAEKVLFEQIFWAIAVPSSFIMIIVLITTFLGGDEMFEGDVDASIEMDSGAGFQFFTFKNFIGFFTIFGWVGIGCVRGGFDELPTLIIAFICGSIMMATMATIFYFVSRLVEDGTFKMTNAIGRLGEIYLPVPPAGSGIGKVQINVQGTVREIDAMTHDDTLLSTGTVVKVNEIIDGHILLVTKNTSSKL